MDKEDCGSIAGVKQKHIEVAATTFCGRWCSRKFEIIKDIVTRPIAARNAKLDLILNFPLMAIIEGFSC
jgi:hypothetical protein